MCSRIGRSRIEPHTRTIALFLGLILLGFGLVAWQHIVRPPLAIQAKLWEKIRLHHDQDTVYSHLAERFHQQAPGERREPCLRYVQSSQSSRRHKRALAQRLVEKGFTRRLRGRLTVVVEQWRHEHVAKHHRRSLVQERLLFLEAHSKGFDRVLLWANHRRIATALEQAWSWRSALHQPPAQELPRPSPRDIQRLRILWARHKTDISEAGQLSLELPVRDKLTGRRMGSVIHALKVWIDIRGQPPASLDDLHLSSDLHNDGFGTPFTYEPDPKIVRVISPGFDGIRGTRDDRIWGFSWP